ncbi:MAG: fused MFS/spermidine synthase [Pseudomonadota bacterium]
MATTVQLPLKFSTIRFILCILFFFSGCSALTYQVVWQRMLFTLFGVDLESITIIVSVFMFGLGIGAMAGGIIADKIPARLLTMFVLIELSVAVFGFASPTIISGLGSVSVASNQLAMAAMSFAILAFPTILMGATFPILVTYINVREQHIGRSVSTLYFANTLGGAVGAFFSGFYLLEHMDLVGATRCAALVNLCIALSAWLIFRRKI